MKLKRFDAVLPQDDEDPDLRQIELEEKKSVYEFVTKDGIMPLLKTFPEDESFSNDYKVLFIFFIEFCYEYDEEWPRTPSIAIDSVIERVDLIPASGTFMIMMIHKMIKLNLI